MPFLERGSGAQGMILSASACRQVEQRRRPSTNTSAIMVSGCTGFIGSRLAARLSLLGYSVRGLTRQNMEDRDNIAYVRADVFDLPKLTKLMGGIGVAYYLLHSMEGSKSEWQNFAKREREQAQNFLKAAEASGVKRIIYLGGLVNCGDGAELSPHMKSRKDVGQILASGSIPVTETASVPDHRRARGILCDAAVSG